MFGSKSRHQVAIRGDTCSTVESPYSLLTLSANALCIFLLFAKTRVDCLLAVHCGARGFEPDGRPR
jgi:hypothetical protein